MPPKTETPPGTVLPSTQANATTPQTPPQPDPAALAPDPNAPPVETPPEPDPVPAGDTGVSKSLLDIIHQTLNPELEVPEVQPAPEPVTDPNAAPAAPAVPDPAAPAAAAPAPAPAKKVKVSISQGHPIVNAVPVTPPQPTAPAPTPSPAPVADQLTDEQREELEEAEVAARLFPDRYKDLPGKLRAWYGDFSTRAKALIASDPNITEEDEPYQALLTSKPALKTTDYKKVVRELASEQAVGKAEQRLAPKLDRLEMESRRAAVMPDVTNFARQVFPKGVQTLIMNDEKSPLRDAIKLFQEKGADAVKEEFPLEFEVGVNVFQAGAQQVQEFLLLKNNAVPFDEKNTLHQQVNQFIVDSGHDFAQRGGKYLVQNGRQFLPRDQFIGMLSNDKAEAGTFDRQKWQTGRYWTFDDNAIVDMMAISTKENAEKAVKSELDNAARRGFQRAPKKTVAVPQTPAAKAPTEIRPPQARGSMAPGAAKPASRQPPVDPSPIPISMITQSLKIKK